jgi:glycosyltransferase involved in cell wall biosynthesis
MPATLIEGAMCGRPSIATSVGAIPEVVLDGRTGYLVPVGDVARMRDAVARVAADPDGARTLGRAARAHCLDTYAIDVVADRWGDVIEAARRYTGRQ